MKLKIDSSWFWDDILIFVESIEPIILFPDAVMICDLFCAVILQQIGSIFSEQRRAMFNEIN